MATAAKIGRTEITTEQFRQIYNDRLQQVGRQIGRSLTMEQARVLGLDRRVLADLTADMALDQRAQSLRLGLSDAEVRRRITSIPGFQTPAGQFDYEHFLQAIREAGYTEQRFIAEQRRATVRNQLSGTIKGGPLVPKAAVELKDRYENEQRSADYVLFDHAQAGEIAAPTPDVLARYFEERKVLFRAPEYRKLQIVKALPSDEANWGEVSDDEIKKAYDDHPDAFGTPERRQLQEMAYPTVEAAAADAERITKGASFTDIAKERGIADKDLDLGTLPKSAIIDRPIADAAFALKEGETSAPVEGRFGIALIHVIKIEPGQIKPLAEVAPEIKRAIATERARSKIGPIYDKMEDTRSEGHTLAEAAATLNLPVRTVELDRSGRDPAGQPVADLPDAQRLLAAAFTTDVGFDADPLQAQGGGYIWFTVEGITPSRERTLDEVKDKVEASWREDEIAKRLQQKAEAFLGKLKGGSNFAETARAEGLKVETVNGLKRGVSSPPLSASVADKIFATPKDAVASAEAEQPGEEVVFRVTDVVLPKTDMTSDAAKTMAQELNSRLAEDLFSQYVTKVESEIGVTINRNAINQVVSGGAIDTGPGPGGPDLDF
jgi:peptidyl-prolyl cis-trans isomerase D